VVGLINHNQRGALMRLPIDTGAMTFMCASEPAPVLDFETKQQKADEHGQPLFATQVVVLSEGGAQVVSLKTPGRPDIEPGQMLAVRELVAIPWEIGDRNGIAFRAGSLEATGGGTVQRKAA
jgi:hypothetical protein